MKRHILLSFCLLLAQHVQAQKISSLHSSIAFPYPDAYINGTQIIIIGTLLNKDQQTIGIEPVDVYINNQFVGSTTSTIYGHFYLTIENNFPDGVYEVRAMCDNNSSVVGPNFFTIKTVAPAAPSIRTPIENEILGHTTVRIEGTTEPGATVEIFFNNQAYSVVAYADEQGNWSAEQSVENGVHSFVAQATDRAGNLGALSEPRHFSVDTLVS